jgi:hypothetical protein
MMRTSISTAGTSLPAITPRRLNRARGQAKDAQALAFDLNLEELRGSSSPAGALFHTSPVVWSGEFSPQEIDSPSSLHTWIDPVSSRPTTTEGKETSRPPSQRPENAREQPSFSGSLGSPELIPVQGIGSVSVRLAADKDECVIDYGSSFIESSPVLGNEGFAHPGHEPNEDPEADWTQQGMQKRLSDYDRMEDEYRTTSAYYVQGAQYYGSKDVQPGQYLCVVFLLGVVYSGRVENWQTLNSRVHASAQSSREALLREVSLLPPLSLPLSSRPSSVSCSQPVPSLVSMSSLLLCGGFIVTQELDSQET